MNMWWVSTCRRLDHRSFPKRTSSRHARRYTLALRKLMKKAHLSFLNVDLRWTQPRGCLTGMMSYPNFGGTRGAYWRCGCVPKGLLTYLLIACVCCVCLYMYRYQCVCVCWKYCIWVPAHTLHIYMMYVCVNRLAHIIKHE